jgi:hypothetical protein
MNTREGNAMRNKSYAVCIVFLAFSICLAEKRYIDPVNGLDTYAGTSEAQAWKTIAKANQTLVAGDTVLIKTGTYNDATINPARSGSSESERITYRNFENDIVTITNAQTYDVGLRLDTKSYITIQGIHFTGQKRFLYIRYNSNYNIISFCTFDSAKMTNGQTATWAGSVISGSSQHNWIHHCRFSNYGYYTNDDISCVIDIGAESDSTDTTRYNLIENSQFFHGGHHVMGIYGKYNVIRNNWFHNEPWSMGTPDADRGAVLYGDRNLSFSGYSKNGGRNLIEGNRIGFSADPSDNNGASGASLNSSENIVRFNTFFHNISAGLSMSVTSSYLQDILRNKVYNNSFFNNGHNPYDSIDHMSSGIGFGIYSGPLVIKDNALKNNVLYKHKLTFGEYNINISDRTGIMAVQVFANNWDGDKKGDPKFVDANPLQGDPMDSLLPDLHLTAASPCIDSGTYLTTIVSASGSGTSFQVADAGYFMDGWGINGVSGDDIQIFGTNQRARITSVNYQTNGMVIDRSVTWTQNQGIGLTYEGTAPDIGAYEFASGNSVVPAARTAAPAKRFQSYAVFSILGRKIGVMTVAQLKAAGAARLLRTGIYVAREGTDNDRTAKRIAVIR